MAADNEHRLVSKVVKDRVIIPVLERGIQPGWFVDEEVQRVWEFIRDHYGEYKEVPTAATVKDHYPNFPLYNVEDSLDYLIDQMVNFRRSFLTKHGMEDALEALQQNDHEKALLEMSKTVSIVQDQGTKGTNHVNLKDNADSRWEAYKNTQGNKLLGIPTGFEKIDEATAGLQPGQLITVIAPPKTGKSQIALQVAINTNEQGYVPMFQSFEMNNHEQQQRYDSMKAKLSNARLRRGKLTQEEEKRYQKMLAEQSEQTSFHLVDAVNGLTTTALLAAVERLKPEIVFVDGVYLMLDEITGESNTPQALTNITRSLKRMAQRLQIPIVITTQTLLWKMKKNKVSADSIGYSSSFFQDSDVIIGLEEIEDSESTRNLRVVQSRNCGPTQTTITWRWDIGCFHDFLYADECQWCQADPDEELNSWGLDD